jgi:hypothetical protein
MSRHSPKEIERIKRISASADFGKPKAQGSLAAMPGSPDKMQPKLTIKSAPIDLELCELLGDKPSDFLVLCFDGVQLDFFGTPYDSPRARVERQGLVDAINDTSEDSLWPDMWKNWKAQICQQFKLPETTTSDKYRPVVTLEISRVCAGYSEHLHAAIGLFETIADKIASWSIIHKPSDESCCVEVFTRDFKSHICKGHRPSLVIAECVCELLKANQENS